MPFSFSNRKSTISHSDSLSSAPAPSRVRNFTRSSRWFTFYRDQRLFSNRKSTISHSDSLSSAPAPSRVRNFTRSSRWFTFYRDRVDSDELR
ncbi:hypothetical protein CFP56_042322 [Quercus suber]|uniref:Uncharacterized protein n=1 Tax=Quercus suber TaxID=58331 RepID=A0AAW0LJP6_QUESU